MKYGIELDGPGAPRIELVRSLVTGSARLYIDGAKAEPRDVGHHQVRVADGRTVELHVQRARWDGSERFLIDGREVWLARRLRWYEAVVAFLPLVMILGGAIPAAIGAGALAANLVISRLGIALWVRAFACVAVLASAAGVAIAIGAWL